MFKISFTDSTKNEHHQKIINTYPSYLNTVFAGITDEIILNGAYVELQDDPDDPEGFLQIIVCKDEVLRDKMLNRLKIALNSWKGLN